MRHNDEHLVDCSSAKGAEGHHSLRQRDRSNGVADVNFMQAPNSIVWMRFLPRLEIVLFEIFPPFCPRIVIEVFVERRGIMQTFSH